METTEWIQLGALLVSIIVLIIMIINFNNQMKLSFFAEYTKRYQEIMLNLPEGINTNSVAYNDSSERVRRYLRAYIDLCSEEFYLHQNRKIHHKVWENWEQGIKASFQLNLFNEAWEHFDKTSYPEFYIWITKEIIR